MVQPLAPSGLTCAVCRSTYNAHDRRPLIFSSCGHTFCEECLRTENRKSVFQCPSCRQDRDQFRTLKPNFALLDLLEAAVRKEKILQLEHQEKSGRKGVALTLISTPEPSALGPTSITVSEPASASPSGKAKACCGCCCRRLT
nr:RING finger protein 224-like [Penaeus vannamei]